MAAVLRRMGADPVERDFTTDNGCRILDCRGFMIDNPKAVEQAINAVPGVVTVGLFAARGADVLLLGTSGGVKTFEKESYEASL